MKARELRIGNLVNYQTVEGDILVARIDWQDLKWISKDEKGFNIAHSAIPLTEEWLLKFGFEEYEFEDEIFGYVLNDFGYVNEFLFMIRILIDFEGTLIQKPIKYVHQLQNLYFALTVEELTFKSE